MGEAGRDDEVRAALDAVLGDALGEGSAVTGLTRLSGGASRHTWAIDAVDGEGEPHPLVLQRQRAGAVGPTGMAEEADLVRAAGRAGVPVPEVLAAGDGRDDGFGTSWMLARRLDGETIARRILRDDALAKARAALAGQLGRAAAAVHAIPLADAPDLPGPDPLDQLRGLLDSLGHPRPALELGLRWLAERRPDPGPTSVVHGDLRMGNLIVGPDGLRAVLDWELAHRGDGLEDLGWLCVRSWRFGGPGAVAGVGEREELCAAYSSASGRTVDPDELRWWEALGNLRWGVITLVQYASHEHGLTRSVELAAIGRRTCEAEHDLLELIDPGGAVRPTEVAAGAGLPDPPHGVPTAAQLVEAVREWVEGDVAEATEGRVRFHARVAANALAAVERQLALGPAQAEAHARRLAALGVADDAELAAAVREGRLDDRRGEVVAAVRASVADALAVANPTWPADP